MLRQFSAISKTPEYGFYRLSGSDSIPCGTYWIEVAVSGHNTSLSLFKQRSGHCLGFIDVCSGKPWHGFFEGEMIPCCDLQKIQITKSPQRELIAA